FLCLILFFVFFFLLLRPLPRSTLFPYTTLFRSIADVVMALCITTPFKISSSLVKLLFVFRKRPAHCRLFLYLVNTLMKAQGKIIDRKSTRLNSSHVKISYAVFCLKKKKKQKKK